MYFLGQKVRSEGHKTELLSCLSESAGGNDDFPKRAIHPYDFSTKSCLHPTPRFFPAQTCGMFVTLNPAVFDRISISEFRKAPGKSLRNLQFNGLVLYSHSRICGYVLNKRMLDNLRLELNRANRQAIDLAVILRALHPDLLALRDTRPDLALRINSFLAAMIANHTDIRPPELVRNL